MSSAKAAIWVDLTASGKEFTNRRNNMGPRIDPCGTPEVTGKGLGVVVVGGIDCAGTISAMLAGSPKTRHVQICYIDLSSSIQLCANLI